MILSYMNDTTWYNESLVLLCLKDKTNDIILQLSYHNRPDTQSYCRFNMKPFKEDQYFTNKSDRKLKCQTSKHNINFNQNKSIQYKNKMDGNHNKLKTNLMCTNGTVVCATSKR